VETPFAMKADYVLAALTLLPLALGTLGAIRAPRWARRTADRRLWRVGLRMLPQVLPIVLLIQLSGIVGPLMNRQGTLAQLTYIWPALVICLGAAALAATVVITARVIAVFLTRRRGRRAIPAPARAPAGLFTSQLVDRRPDPSDHADRAGPRRLWAARGRGALLP
jgi:hypothetical protein